LQRFGEKI
jgi:hypothetical protein